MLPSIKHLLLILSIIVTAETMAQEPNFSWGIPLPKVAKKQNVTIFGEGSAVYYIVTQQPAGIGEFSSSYQLEAFKSANHDRVFSKTITPPAMYDVAGVAYIDNKPVLFYYGFVKDAGKDVLYTIDYSSDGSASSPREIITNPAEKMAQRGRYDIVQSPDKKFMLISYEPNFRKGENEQLQLSLLDEKLSKQWSSMQTLPYEWKRGVNNFIHVNNSGVASIVKRMVMKGEDNSYSILSFDGKKLNNHPVDLGEGKKVVIADKIISNNGELVVAGYYTEDKSIRIGNTNYYGSFIYALSSQGDRLNLKHVNEFDEKRKGLEFKYILPLSNGYVLLGQKASETSSLSSDAAKAAKGERDYTYYSGDIYADAYSADGKKLFAKVINRTLDSKNDFGVSNSFFAAVDNDQLRIIYNDEQTRYDGKKHIITFGWIPLIPVLITINTATGEAQKPIGLFNSGGVGGKNAEMRMRPDVFVKISDNKYLLRGENNQLFKMGTVSF